MSAFTDAFRKQIPRTAKMSDAEVLVEARKLTGFRGSQREFNVTIGEQPRTTGAARMVQVFGQGTSASFGDELAGAFAPLLQPAIGALDIATGGSIGDNPGLEGAFKSAKLALDGKLSQDVMQVARREVQMAREDAPVAAMGAELAGGVTGGLAAGGGLANIGGRIAAEAPRLGAVMQAVGNASTPLARMVGGAGGGALYGAGAADEGDRLQGAAQGAALGGLIPPAAAGVGKLGLGATRLASQVSPTAHMLRALAGAAAPHGLKTAARDLVGAGMDLARTPFLGRAMGAVEHAGPGRVLAPSEARAIRQHLEEGAAPPPAPPTPSALPRPPGMSQADVDGITQRLSREASPAPAAASAEDLVMQANDALGGKASIKEIAEATGLTEPQVIEATRNIIMKLTPGARPSAATVLDPAAPPTPLGPPPGPMAPPGPAAPLGPPPGPMAPPGPAQAPPGVLDLWRRRPDAPPPIASPLARTFGGSPLTRTFGPAPAESPLARMFGPAPGSAPPAPPAPLPPTGPFAPPPALAESPVARLFGSTAPSPLARTFGTAPVETAPAASTVARVFGPAAKKTKKKAAKKPRGKRQAK